nr:unnamed protein product [Callosobruchus chinensis]
MQRSWLWKSFHCKSSFKNTPKNPYWRKTICL